MRKLKEIQNEIIKMRKLVKLDISEKVSQSAWDMLLALEWVTTTHKKMPLSPMDLTGITMDQARAYKKKFKREQRVPLP